MLLISSSLVWDHLLPTVWVHPHVHHHHHLL
jgi:hypothetical protein